MTEREEEEKEKQLREMDETEQIVNVDGTIARVSGKVVEHVEELRRETMTLKIPQKQQKQVVKESGKENRQNTAKTTTHGDYQYNKICNNIRRRRTDPLVSFASYLEIIHNQLRRQNEALPFLQPVNPKKVPDYLDIIQRPMDLQSIRENIQHQKYHSREDFLNDINQIVENSSVYNGTDHIYTVDSKKLLEIVISKFTEEEDLLMNLEKAINPLFDDDDQAALSYILESVLNDKIKTMQESCLFVKVGNKEQTKHNIIKEAMDLETISEKVSKHMYYTREEFWYDLDLIHRNSIQFNGPESEYTYKAKKILDVAKEALFSYADYLAQLEKKIGDIEHRSVDESDVEAPQPFLGELDVQGSENISGYEGSLNCSSAESNFDKQCKEVNALKMIWIYQATSHSHSSAN